MEPIDLPRDLDKPQTFLFMTGEDLVIFAVIFMIGTMVGHPITYSLIGVGIVLFFRRFRDNHANGFLLHILYWYGLIPVSGRNVLNPFQRTVYPQ